MQPSKTSKQWMREHVNDPYVQMAQKDGYRSRAAYKLLEINEKGTANVVNACLNKKIDALCHVSSIGAINNLDYALVAEW